MQHARLQAHRAEAEVHEIGRQFRQKIGSAGDFLARQAARDASRKAPAPSVSSPSLTARRSRSQEATCMSRVVRRMLSVA